MNDDEPKTLEAQLGENDWAIIIGDDGNLKGLFIPEGMTKNLYLKVLLLLWQITLA